MRAALVSLATLIAIVSANPVTKRGGAHCGTTDDATLSDCQALVDPATWASVYNPDGNICHFSNPLAALIDQPAFNVACHGDCCVYVTAPGDKYHDIIVYASGETIRQQAAGLFGCANPDANKVNAMQKFEDGHAVCISNGNGCGDCFDDADFAFD